MYLYRMDLMIWCFCAETRVESTYRDPYTIGPYFPKVLFKLFSDSKDEKIAKFSLLTC